MSTNPKPQSSIKLFQDQKIRSAWDEERGEWFFSVVDVVGALTDSASHDIARDYWKVLKHRLKKEGADQLVTNCNQLKMPAADGKMRKTDIMNTEQLLRLIQSIPSKKAEPFKLWLARVGRERIEETIDPELTINRALETYLKKGYDEDWIHQRLLSIRIRNELTTEWKERGMKEGKDFAILTDDISKAEQPEGLKENRQVAKRGGNVAGIARKELEKNTGKPVISPKSATELGTIIPKLLKNPPKS